MILELCEYRGTMVWIDGICPDHSWSCGGDDAGCLTMSNQTMTGEPLHIGEHRAKEIRIHTNDTREYLGVFGSPGIPQEVTLVTTDGEYRGAVTEVVYLTGDKADGVGPHVGQPINEDGLFIVKLQNGEDYAIDEIKLYLKAQVEKL